MPPNLETICEEDVTDGEFAEVQLNPFATPYVPVRDATTAAVHVEPIASEGPVAPEPEGLSSTVEEQAKLPASREGLRTAQKADVDVGFIRQLVESGVDKPVWNDIVQQAREAKTLWSFWPRLSVRDGLLQRKFISIEQQTEFWQIMMPKSHRREFIDLVHAGSTGGHFGLKKTSAAVQRRAYWSPWSSDIESYIKRCTVCAQYHREGPRLD